MDRSFYLQRLPPEYYRGDAVVHWTLTTYDCERVCATQAFHGAFREFMLHTCGRYSMLCPVYCIMPDHLHFVWMGLARGSDQMKAIAFFDTYLEPVILPARFQPQPHDSVLREKARKRNAFSKACRYIAENPVRAGLAGAAKEWPFTGGVVLGYPSLDPLGEGCWEKFWRIYYRLRRSDAGQVVRPGF